MAATLTALSGCKGGGENPGLGDPICACDAAILPHDAQVCLSPHHLSSCNPVTQGGCEPGKKCASLSTCDEPPISSARCVPNGTVGEGEACARGATGPSSGYDDCVAGLHCLDGICAPICDVGPPDSCRAEGDVFGEGAYCNLREGLFLDNIGVCVASCDTNDDSASGGVIASTDCGMGQGCRVEGSQGITFCDEVPTSAAQVTQNKNCYGSGFSGCDPSGCAIGFTPLLVNKPQDADGSLCARYCRPVDSYAGNDANVQGSAGNCTVASLDLVGGTNGEGSEHQCRFIQNFYPNTAQIPAEVGMCVPIAPNVGGSWADCRSFDWDGMKAVWNDAVTSGGDPYDAFNNYCLETPGDPSNSEIKSFCLGLFYGCISLAEEEAGFLGVPGSAFVSRSDWAAGIGLLTAKPVVGQ